MAKTSAVKEITDKLEAGMNDLFESEKYAAYLQTMSRFHRYSTRNTLLIHMQRPSATRVAGYNDWKNKFKRQVKKGEKGIRILAPIPFVKRQEMDKIDPESQRPIIGADGQPVREEVEIRLARFKVVPVFDVEQTEGEPLPELVETLTGDVARYELFMDALRAVSPLPIVFEDLPTNNDGYCQFGEKIAIRNGMSEIQTVAAVIHEITHSMLHDQRDAGPNIRLRAEDEGEPVPVRKDRRTEEVESESVAFAVSQYYGIETGANSFGYIAEWSQGRELKELNASLDVIRKTAAELIGGIDEQYHTLAKERGIDLTVTSPDPAQLSMESVVDPIRERLAALSQLESPDEKYQLAFDTLVDALCSNEQLLALANTGAQWQRGEGRAAVSDGGYFETLVGNYHAELVDILSDEGLSTRLNNTVRGEAYRRLDGIAYDRYILDEYADITKSGRLEIYKTPYPEDGGNIGMGVNLTERLPDGSIHDYGVIFGYDPNDSHDHAINNYLSSKAWNELRESVFGKSETTVKLDYREMEPVGSTVLRPLLFTDGQFNRERKRSRVEILPPMGKYSIYAQHLPGVIGDDTLIHIGTDSGYLLPLSVDRTRFEEHFFETQLDRMFEEAGTELDSMLADPKRFAMYQQAAITGRFAEAEAHNIPVRKLREAEREQKRIELEQEEQAREFKLQEKYDGRIDEIAKAIETGAAISVGYDEYEFGGKNPVLDLFKLYNIKLPLRTQGWVNTGLAELSENGYRYYSSKRKGNSSAFGGCLHKLREAIRETPIEQKRGISKPTQEKEVKRGVEHALYNKLAEMFPDFISGKYSYMGLESDGFGPLSLEWIGGNQISVMHTYTMNGDLMYDPMITFEVDRQSLTLKASEFEQSMPPLYQRVGENGDGQSIDGNGIEREIRGLRTQINKFASQWFQNIGEQGFMPVKANLVLGEDNEVRITFDADGNPVMPEQEKQEKQYDLGYGYLGNGITVWNRAEEINGDYATVAHISTEREVTVYEKDMPEAIREKIKAVSQSPEIFDFNPVPGTPISSDTKSKIDEPEMSLPDPTQTADDMYSYGYTQEDMHPLSAERAAELFDSDHTIYLLYPDNTEMLAFDRDEIITFGSRGICGITKADWELSPEYAAQMAALKTTESSKESDLLFGGEDKFGIYQLKSGDETHYHRFESLESLQRHGLSVERDNYELIYTAPLTDNDTLNGIYERFNINRPADFTGHSLSMSDIIVMQRGGEVSSHYVDNFGFAELPVFTGNEREQSQEVQAPVPSYSQVENSSPNTTVSKQQPPVSKGKPSLLGKLEANKRKVAQRGQPEQRRPNGLEV